MQHFLLGSRSSLFHPHRLVFEAGMDTPHEAIPQTPPVNRDVVHNGIQLQLAQVRQETSSLLPPLSDDLPKGAPEEIQANWDKIRRSSVAAPFLAQSGRQYIRTGEGVFYNSKPGEKRTYGRIDNANHYLFTGNAFVVGAPAKHSPNDTMWWHERFVLPNGKKVFIEARTGKELQEVRSASGVPLYTDDGKHFYRDTASGFQSSDAQGRGGRELLSLLEDPQKPGHLLPIDTSERWDTLAALVRIGSGGAADDNRLLNALVWAIVEKPQLRGKALEAMPYAEQLGDSILSRTMNIMDTLMRYYDTIGNTAKAKEVAHAFLDRGMRAEGASDSDLFQQNKAKANEILQRR